MKRYKVIEGCTKKYNYHIVDTKKKIFTDFGEFGFRIVESFRNEWIAKLCCDALNEKKRGHIGDCISCGKQKRCADYNDNFEDMDCYELPF